MHHDSLQQSGCSFRLQRALNLSSGVSVSVLVHVWHIWLNLHLWPGFRITPYCSEADIPWALGLWFFLEGSTCVCPCVQALQAYRQHAVDWSHMHLSLQLQELQGDDDWAICHLWIHTCFTKERVFECMMAQQCRVLWAVMWWIDIKLNICKELQDKSQRMLEKKIPQKWKWCSFWFSRVEKATVTLCCLTQQLLCSFIHVFFLWGSTVLKIFNDPNKHCVHSQQTSDFWPRVSADTSQPTSLNFLPVSTEAGSRRWESITHLQNVTPSSINSVIQFRSRMWSNFSFLLSVDCVA